MLSSLSSSSDTSASAFSDLPLKYNLSTDSADSSDELDEKDDEFQRKNGLSLLLRQIVCCSCFPSERRTSKYQSNVSANIKTFKTLPADVNGKRKKPNDCKKAVPKSDNMSKEKNSSNNVIICSPPAQSVSASDGTESGFREGRNGDSQDISSINQPIKIITDNQRLLPKISEKNKDKKCFIIDLDETLVHSSFKFVKTADIKVNVEIDGIQHEVFVCKRPYVDEFLEELGHLFECVLFTASLGKYADPVTDFLDPNGIFEARLFREACAFKEGNYVKDLDAIGRDINEIVILDNSPVSYLLHPRHALQIVSWFDDQSDTALKDLIPYFKDLAETSLSVPEWLEQNRPPESAGVLGHPQSNLHWILMQTLSVPEAVAIYKQKLRESYHASDSSNVSRQSSIRESSESHEQHTPHHGLITQAINRNQHCQSLAVPQDNEEDRPPVSSPVARPHSTICLDEENDGVNDKEDMDYLVVDGPESGQVLSIGRFVVHSNVNSSNGALGDTD